jgi:hypothetical protein
MRNWKTYSEREILALSDEDLIDACDGQLITGDGKGEEQKKRLLHVVCDRLMVYRGAVRELETVLRTLQRDRP